MLPSNFTPVNKITHNKLKSINMKQDFNLSGTSAKQLKLGFRIHLLAFLVLTPAIWIVWSFTDTTYPWPLWSTPAWLVGVIFHYLGVFVFKKRNQQ